MYISFGRQARQSVPVYIHLPGCVFVAMIFVSMVATVVTDLDIGTTELWERKTQQMENSLQCHHLLGWTCSQYLPRALFLGVVCGAIAVGLINWSLHFVTELTATAANSFEPVSACLIGIVLFAEPIPNVSGIGAATILIIAMVLCSAGGEKKLKEDKDSKKTVVPLVESEKEAAEAPQTRRRIYRRVRDNVISV